MHYLFFEKAIELLTAKNGFNFGDFLNYWGGLLFSVTVIFGAIWAIAKFFIIPPAKHWVKEFVLEATKQIQPDANGGKSLTDANKKIDRIEKKQDDTVNRLDTLEKMTELKFKHIQEGLDRIEKHLDGK
jgi:hypothetical protein